MIPSGIFELIRDLFFFAAQISGRSSFPTPLGAEEERRCIRLMSQGDAESRQRLIEHNLRLVAHIAKKYQHAGHEQEDLISIGAIGLIKAITTFKPERDTQLATYAARCIENEILMTIRATKKYKNDVSLTEPIGVDREGNEISLIDKLGTDPDSVPDEVSKSLDLTRVLRQIHTRLSKRERLVVELRYGLLDGKPYPQREIAEKLGISRSYVSRIEKRAINMLNDELKV